MTRTHRSKPRRRNIRLAATGAARDAIGTLTTGAEIYVLTYGQFSLIDALVALLEQTGPADVIISTWTAADTDLTTASRLMEGAQITRLRMVVDRSFLTRQPGYCATMRRLFGDECIRTTRSHAKFLLLRNEQWTLAVRTSMNLNHNPRLETIEISDDPALFAFLDEIVTELWHEQDAGNFAGELPLLAGIEATSRAGTVSAGRVDLQALTRAGAGTSPATD